jgi:endonuclease-3
VSADPPAARSDAPSRVRGSGPTPRRGDPGGPKEPFDIDRALTEIAAAVRPYPKAAMFELAERGFASPFQQLVACVISIRTRDETSLPISIRLFERAATPAAIAALSEAEIDAVISPSTFHERKAGQIRAIAQRVVTEYGGELPCAEEIMRSFAGVGAKCANLALGIACGQPKISVDVHVHRIVNRWGYVHTSSPEQTTMALEAKLPRKYWVTINALLVPFGKHICTGVAPKCSTCPVLAMCQQVGVTSHR